MPGEVRERLKRHAWKACVLNGTLGSNPSLSAILLRQDTFILDFVGIGLIDKKDESKNFSPQIS